MAVFTELTDAECRAVASAYDLGALFSVIGIASGDRETTYLFGSERGEFIVTLFENDAEPLDLELAFQTMERLRSHGIPCPQPRRTATNAPTIYLAERLVAVVSCIPGMQISHANLEQCRDLGRRMGDIHGTLARPERHRSSPLPQGPVHGALVPSNVFFLGDSISGIINFRLRHVDALLGELAYAVVSWTLESDGRLDIMRAGAILDGYLSRRPLEVAELRAFPAFCMAAATQSFGVSTSGADLLAKTRRTYSCAQALQGLHGEQERLDEAAS